MCCGSGSQIGLKVGEAMPEKLVCASLTLTVIAQDQGGLVVHQLSACSGQVAAGAQLASLGEQVGGVQRVQTLCQQHSKFFLSRDPHSE